MTPAIRKQAMRDWLWWQLAALPSEVRPHLVRQLMRRAIKRHRAAADPPLAPSKIHANQ